MAVCVWQWGGGVAEFSKAKVTFSIQAGIRVGALTSLHLQRLITHTTLYSDKFFSITFSVSS